MFCKSISEQSTKSFVTKRLLEKMLVSRQQFLILLAEEILI